MKAVLKAKTRGFTLIELMLYLAIIVIILSALIPFAWNIVSGSAKSNVAQQTNSEARFIAERIKYEIRNSTGINLVSPAWLSLATSNPATNPTVIDYSSSTIRIKQGTGAQTNLNSSATKVSSFIFTNYTSGDNATKNIGFNFALNANYASTRSEYQYTTTIESAAEVRSN